MDEVNSPTSGIFFETHYSNLFKNRWENLYKALKEPVNNIALIPPFYNDIPTKTESGDLEDSKDDHVHIPDNELVYKPTVLPWCYEVVVKSSVDHEYHKNLLFNKNIFDSNGQVIRLNDYVYHLDGASAFAVFCLQANPGDRVLDMCSSPGGKTIILASSMFYEQKLNINGINDKMKMSTTELVDAIKEKMEDDTKQKESLLVCNEPVRLRYKRVQETVKRFIPDKLISGKHIQFVNFDATVPVRLQRFGKFDKILLDAPCSSERHVINKELPWSYKNTKQNSKRQLKLIETAISLLKSEGILLYCTCALDPMENELVINTVLRSYSDMKHVEINYDEILSSFKHFNKSENSDYNKFQPEKRVYGCSLMPDKSGFGPIYIVKLQKT